jgi:hypothetical protein
MGELAKSVGQFFNEVRAGHGVKILKTKKRPVPKDIPG